MADKTIVYLDYAATTPVDAEVIAAALPYYGASFFNPASAHILGQTASGAVEFARRRCEKAINAEHGTVYFTSGGTESINWAMKCVKLPKGGKIVVSAIEHEAVIACAERLESLGHEIVRVMPDKNGIISPDAVERAAKGAVLVCVMTVNNIVGTVQPINRLAAAAHANGALFFTDAVQAVNSVKIDVKDSDVDMLCVSGHKFYAPKGVGFLYVKRGVELAPLMDGGSQESGMRAGTVDVPSVIALSEALTRASVGVEEYNAHAHAVRKAFIDALDCGTPIATDAPHIDDIVSVRFDGVNGGRLAVALSVAGVCCSVGSACSAGSATPPATLVAMGVDNADECVRFSFGKPTTESLARSAAQTVNETVKRLKRAGRAALVEADNV